MPGVITGFDANITLGLTGSITGLKVSAYLDTTYYPASAAPEPLRVAAPDLVRPRREHLDEVATNGSEIGPALSPDGNRVPWFGTAELMRETFRWRTWPETSGCPFHSGRVCVHALAAEFFTSPARPG